MHAQISGAKTHCRSSLEHFIPKSGYIGLSDSALGRVPCGEAMPGSGTKCIATLSADLKDNFEEYLHVWGLGKAGPVTARRCC